MNLLLLEEQDFEGENTAFVSGQRAAHLKNVVGVSVASTVRCGRLGGKMGIATVENITSDKSDIKLHLSITLTEPPPVASSLELLCALPRPKMLRRIVRTCAELGVKRIGFVNSYRVEKSYWQSPQLSDDALRSFCLEGLQQSGDTILPQIDLFKRFKPYVEDELPSYLAGKSALLAHPGSQAHVWDVRPSEGKKCVLAVGPEGGFIDYEVERLQEKGFLPFSVGPRILRCDTAVPYLIAALQTAK